MLVTFPRRRMSCKDALAHPWIAAFDSADQVTGRSLSKEKMKRFLARQKWKVTHLTTYCRNWIKNLLHH